MTSLTETAFFSKKAFKWLIWGFGIILVLVLLIVLGKTIISTIFPAKPPPATVAFGKLPKLDLSEGFKIKGTTSFTIETISGQLPNLVDKAKVFAIDTDESSFGALERAKIRVSKIGFKEEPQEVAGSTFKFQDPKENRSITINIASGNFILESNYQNDPQIISTRPRSLEAAIDLARDFFNNFDVTRDDFPQDKIQTAYFRLDGGNLTKTPALSSANLVQMNFQRNSLDGLEVTSPQENNPSAKAQVSERKIVTAELSRLSIRPNKFATYPLKGIDKAFEQLKAGMGAFNKVPTTSTIPVRDVVLAYLETRKYQNYLQPVYVFKSDNGQVAYVGAVDDSWTTVD